MLSALNGPLNLDAVTVPENGMSPGILGFSGQKGPFSDIMANIQGNHQHGSGQLAQTSQATQLSPSAKTLENLPLPPKLTALLKELVSDGNNLPEEAKDILEQLKLDFESLADYSVDFRETGETSTPGHLKFLEKLFEKLDLALEKLELSKEQLDSNALGLLEQIKSEIGEIHQALLEQFNLATHQPGSEASITEVPVTEVPDVKETPLGSKKLFENTGDTQTPLEHHSVAVKSASEILQTHSGSSVDAEEIVLTDNRSNKPASLSLASSQAGFNDKKADNFFKPNNPAFNQANLNSGGLNPENIEGDIDPDINLNANSKAVEMKNIANSQLMGSGLKSAPPAHSSAWLHSNALAAKMSSESGFSGTQSNNSGTTFAQMMSQAAPAPLTQNIHMPQWGKALGQRIAWMIGSKLQSAQLRITPAHLGPVEIKLSIENNQAQVSFVSQHQVVRDAIEQAVPRLREMFDQQNLDLGDVDVSDRKLAEQGDSNESQSAFSDDNQHADDAGQSIDENLPEEHQVVQVNSDGILDTYA